MRPRLAGLAAIALCLATAGGSTLAEAAAPGLVGAYALAEGELDELRVYNQPLSAAEIQADMAAQLAPQ